MRAFVAFSKVAENFSTIYESNQISPTVISAASQAYYILIPQLCYGVAKDGESASLIEIDYI